MRLRLGIALLGAAAVVGMGSACSRTDPAPGELMLAVQTDMHAPKDVDAVGIYVAERDPVTQHDTLIFGFAEKVAPDGTVHFPATLAVVGKKNPGATVRVRAVAFQKTKATIVRDAITTIPTDRAALLRLPLRWIDDNGKTQGSFVPDGSLGSSSLAPTDFPSGNVGAPRAGDALIDGFQQIISGCADNETPLNGGCAPATIDSATLPNYDDGVVFGGGTPDGGGVCFDAAKCFAGAHQLDLDFATCSAPAPAGVFDLAVMTAPGGLGDCDANGCYLPLDKDTPEGWTIQNGRVVLPGAYCDRIHKGDALGIVDDDGVPGCAPKANDAPLCSPASVVGSGSGINDDAGPISDGGLDGTLSDTGPQDSGPPPIVELATGLDAPTALAVDGTDVYVTVRNGMVFKLSTSPGGGATQFFDPLDAGDGGRFDAGPTPEVRVSARGGNVVVAVTQVVPTNGPSVYLLHSDGGLAQRFVTDGGVIYDVHATPTEAVWDYYGAYPFAAVQSYAWGSDAGVPTTLNTNALSPNYRPVRDMAYDESNAIGPSIFFLDENGSQTLAAKAEPLGSSSLSSDFVSFTQPSRGGIAVDKNNVYFALSGVPQADGGAPPGMDGIYACNRAGAGKTAMVGPTDFALKGTDVSTLPHRLAVDGTGLFWTNANDEVWSLATQVSNPDGGAPLTKLVASGQGGARDVAVDANYIYWTATTAGVVRRGSRAALGLP